VCVYICMFACICVCIYMYVGIYIYVYKYVFMYVCVLASVRTLDLSCLYICTCNFTTWLILVLNQGACIQR
jgi:hypothetical protein